MREVYYNSGLESLPDHTVLELLLYFGIPMRDTNETAHLLLEKFGSFSAVLRADRNDLKTVPGMTENAACLLSMLLPVFRRYSDDLTKKRVSIFSVDELVSYVKPKFLDSANERLFAVFADSGGNVISSKMISEGNLSSTGFDFRVLVSACLETKAKNVVLAHNHPSNISAPSTEDIEFTKFVSEYLRVIDVEVSDHIIISRDGFTSMASIKKFSKIFSNG